MAARNSKAPAAAATTSNRGKGQQQQQQQNHGTAASLVPWSKTQQAALVKNMQTMARAQTEIFGLLAASGLPIPDVSTTA